MQHFHKLLKSSTLKDDFPNQDKLRHEPKMGLCLVSMPDVKICQNIFSLTFVPQFDVFLIADHVTNRIGVYEEDFSFRSWLHIGGTSPIENPFRISCLKNGFVAILDERHLHILDTTMHLCQSIPGSYCGLGEGPDGILVVMLKSSQKTFVKMLKMDENYVFKWNYATELVVAQGCQDWAISTCCKYIVCTKECIYISDFGLKKIYMVDRRTHKQSTSPLSLNQPSGILVDEDNFLIADCCKIVLCDSLLQTSRVLIDGLPFLCELIRHGDYVLAIQSKHAETTILKLEMRQESTHDNFINAWFEKSLKTIDEETRSNNADK